MKKIFALVLSMALVFCMSFNAFAATWADIIKDLPLKQTGYLALYPDLLLGDTYPGEIFLAPINRALFGAMHPIGYTDLDNLTHREVSLFKIKPKIEYIRGRNVVAGISIEGSKQYKRKPNYHLYFVDVFPSVDSVDFEYLIYLQIDGVPYKELGTIIRGTFSNHIVQVGSGTDFFDFYGGDVVMDLTDPILASNNLELDLGSGISLYSRKFLPAQKYWVYAQRSEVADEDGAITEKYPSINEIITIQQINLGVWPKADSENPALFGWEARLHDYPGLYVYAQAPNGTMLFLGKSDNLLPVVEKYYLSSLPLNVGDALSTAI